VAANLSDATLDPTDSRQRLATVPSGLQDYVNLYLPAGAARTGLTSLLNDAIARADQGQQDASVVDSLLAFIRSAQTLNRSGALTRSQTAAFAAQASIGIQVFLGRPQSVTAAGFAAGSVAPNSIVTIFGEGLSAENAASPPQSLQTTLAGATVTVIDSSGAERLARLFLVSPTQINYLASLA
jgi:hypothetical protein